MKDIMFRVLLSAVVGALVSASILYFAFDQSLRGIETSISVLDSRISENGEWIRANNRSLEAIGNEIGGKLDDLSEQVADSSLNTRASIGQLMVVQRDFGVEYSGSLATTMDTIRLLSQKLDLSAADRETLAVLLARMAESQRFFGSYPVIVPETLIDWPAGSLGTGTPDE